MDNLFITILAVSLVNIVSWIISQGFQHSYFGKNSREELTRFWNSLSKHMRKQNENSDKSL